MAARLLQLFALLAVVLMPFGMAAPSATAAAPEAVVHMAAGHCDEQSPSQQDTNERLSNCAMACAMLLFELAPVPQGDGVAADARCWSNAGWSAGMRPEMDPPPPKLS